MIAVQKADGLYDVATGLLIGGNPDPPDVQQMFLGSCTGVGQSLAQQQTLFSKTSAETSKDGAVNQGIGIHRTYTGEGLVANHINNTPAAGDVAAGVASFWSTKPDIDDVNAGNQDSRFTALFNSIPAGHRFYMVCWHEPWDDQFNWANYRSMMARVWDLLKASNADPALVKFGVLGTEWDFIQGQAQPNFFPSVAKGYSENKFDFVGVDGYDFYRNRRNNVMPASPNNPPREKHRKPNVMYGDCMTYAASVGKPVVVGEYGFHSDPENLTLSGNNWEGVPSKAKRLKDLLDYFLANNVEAACYFQNHNGTDGPWWLDVVHNFTTPTDRSGTVDAPVLEVWRNYLALYGKDPA